MVNLVEPVPEAILCVPALRNIHIQTTKCLFDAYGTGRYEVMFHWNDAIMSRTRARMVTRFLREYPDVKTMVFVDSDMVFSVEALHDLVHLSYMNQCVVGGVYPTRGEGKTTVNLMPDSTLKVGPGQRPQRVKSIGTGFLAIPREVLILLAQGAEEVSKNTDIPYFRIFNHIMEDGAELAEDTSFCRRVDAVGVKILAMPGHQIGHIGDYVYKISPGARIE